MCSSDLCLKIPMERKEMLHRRYFVSVHGQSICDANEWCVVFGSKVKYGLRFHSCSELITAAVSIKLIDWTTGVHQSFFFFFAGGCCLHLVILQCISEACILFGYAVYGRNPAPVHVENPIFCYADVMCLNCSRVSSISINNKFILLAHHVLRLKLVEWSIGP